MRWLMMTVMVWVAALVGGDARPTVQGTDVRNGEFRTWHSNGQLAEVRRYVEGREDGLQQSWTPEGVMYLNYEVRAGRRYGLVNSRPCLPAEETAEGGL